MINYTIIIPHHNGEEMLSQCIESIYISADYKPEIIIVNNASTDGSIETIKTKFSNIIVVDSQKNLGYAGGCNVGALEATNDYLIFLNNDTILEKSFDKYLLNKLQNKDISSVQPKIKNLPNKDYFDYAGASGGFLDVFCYPFCRGRIFNNIEKDLKQYDSEKEIFWASGAAFATKKDIFIKAGMFDIKLFAHMEEIDYHWRCQMMGYKIMINPKSIVYHQGGGTLSYESHKKTYLNHRNSLIIFLSNHKIHILFLLLIPRMILQLGSIFLDLLSIRLGHAIAQLQALLWIPFNIFYIIKKRIKNRSIQLNNYNLKGMYFRSIAIDYFLLKKKKFINLKNVVQDF